MADNTVCKMHGSIRKCMCPFCQDSQVSYCSTCLIEHLNGSHSNAQVITAANQIRRVLDPLKENPNSAARVGSDQYAIEVRKAVLDLSTLHAAENKRTLRAQRKLDKWKKDVAIRGIDVRKKQQKLEKMLEDIHKREIVLKSAINFVARSWTYEDILSGRKVVEQKEKDITKCEKKMEKLLEKCKDEREKLEEKYRENVVHIQTERKRRDKQAEIAELNKNQAELTSFTMQQGLKIFALNEEIVQLRQKEALKIEEIEKHKVVCEKFKMNTREKIACLINKLEELYCILREQDHEMHERRNEIEHLKAVIREMNEKFEQTWQGTKELREKLALVGANLNIIQKKSDSIVATLKDELTACDESIKGLKLKAMAEQPKPSVNKYTIEEQKKELANVIGEISSALKKTCEQLNGRTPEIVAAIGELRKSLHEIQKKADEREKAKEKAAILAEKLLTEYKGNAAYEKVKEAYQQLATNSEANISLNKCSVDDKGAAIIACGLKISTRIRTIGLVQNSIGPEGAKALGDALKGQSSLVALNMMDCCESGNRGNPLGDDGAKALADGLKSNTALGTLCLYDCNIGDVGAAALAEATNKGASALTLLYLGYKNNISDPTGKKYGFRSDVGIIGNPC